MTTEFNGKPGPPKKATVMRYVYVLSHVIELKELLHQMLKSEFLNKTLTADDFDRLVASICATLPGSAPFDTIKESLRNLAGKLVTDAMLLEASWRVAGNLKRLRRKRVVPLWHQQQMYEWVPAHIVACRRKLSYGKRGAEFEFRIMAGTSVSLSAHKWWSFAMCHYMADKFGYTRSRGRQIAKYPYTAPEQLVGFRLNLLIDPTLCGRAPGFRRVAFGSGVDLWNKETLRCRFRVHNTFSCQLHKDVSVLPCHMCPIGYTQCRAGTHRKTWERRHCSQCRQDAWFDPDRPGTLCVSCLSKNAYEEDH